MLIKILAKDRNLDKINQENLNKEVNHISEIGISKIECDLNLDNSKNNKDYVIKELMNFLVESDLLVLTH